MSEKRTIESFLKELQPEHAEAAIKEFNKPRQAAWRLRHEYEFAENRVDAIEIAFAWTESEKGFNYWRDIWDKLSVNKYQFPPQPVKEVQPSSAVEVIQKRIDYSKAKLPTVPNPIKPIMSAQIMELESLLSTLTPQYPKDGDILKVGMMTKKGVIIEESHPGLFIVQYSQNGGLYTNEFEYAELVDYVPPQSEDHENPLAKSLRLFDEFLKETPKDELDKMIAEVQALGITGPTMDEYMAAFGKRAQAEVDNGGWIDIKERLPEIGVEVLCQLTQTSMGGTNFITPRVGKMLTKHGRFSCAFDWINVTHWMPLPTFPGASSPAKPTQSGEATDYKTGFVDGFKQGENSKTSEAMEVLIELVRLKNIHDVIEAEKNSGEPTNTEYFKLVEEYETRKPLAWERARSLVSGGGQTETI